MRKIAKKNCLTITNKKKEGDHILYLFVKGKSRRWRKFQDLQSVKDLGLVAEYEKENQEEKELAQVQEQTNEENSEKQEDTQKQKPKDSAIISNLVFLKKREGKLNFKVFFKNGSIKYLNNLQLKQKYAEDLINFYEKNVIVEDIKENILQDSNE